MKPNEEIINEIREYAIRETKPYLKLHGMSHTDRVVENANRIVSDFCPSLKYDVLAAAYLHDLGRVDDAGGCKHAYDGACKAEILLRDYPTLDSNSIIFAIMHHADTKAPNGKFPLVKHYPHSVNYDGRVAMCLWDADRLDLSRVGFRVNDNYLNTDYAKSLIR